MLDTNRYEGKGNTVLLLLASLYRVLWWQTVFTRCSRIALLLISHGRDSTKAQKGKVSLRSRAFAYCQSWTRHLFFLVGCLCLGLRVSTVWCGCLFLALHTLPPSPPSHDIANNVENSVKQLLLQIDQRLTNSLVSKGWFPVKKAFRNSCVFKSPPLMLLDSLLVTFPWSVHSLVLTETRGCPWVWHPFLTLTGIHPSVCSWCQQLLAMTLSGRIAGVLTGLPWFQQKTAFLSQSKTYNCSIFLTKITK